MKRAIFWILEISIILSRLSAERMMTSTSWPNASQLVWRMFSPSHVQNEQRRMQRSTCRIQLFQRPNINLKNKEALNHKQQLLALECLQIQKGTCIDRIRLYQPPPPAS